MLNVFGWATFLVTGSDLRLTGAFGLDFLDFLDGI
jgi:hypothetical protein